MMHYDDGQSASEPNTDLAVDGMLAGMDDAERGRWLLERGVLIEHLNAEWLLGLSYFDERQAYLLDGQTSTVAWLVEHQRLSVQTAYEKLEVAKALRNRPRLAAALGSDRIPYSAAREIARLTDMDANTEEAMLALAEVGTVRDVQDAARSYRLHQDQDRRPCHRGSVRGVSICHTADGMARVTLTTSVEEAEECMAVIRLFMEIAQPDDPDPFPDDGQVVAAAVDSARAESGESMGSAQGATGHLTEDDVTGVDAAPPEWLHFKPYNERQADAAMEMVRTAAWNVERKPASTVENTMVHVIVTESAEASVGDGTPMDPAHAEMLRCDASTVTHHQSERGEALYLGRKSRSWSQAQRREAIVRDGGRCRFPGCRHAHVDLHHHRWWSRDQGPTDITNGYLCCRYHHTLIHQQEIEVSGEPAGTLVFTRSDGQPLGITRPVRRTWLAPKPTRAAAPGADDPFSISRLSDAPPSRGVDLVH